MVQWNVSKVRIIERDGKPLPEPVETFASDVIAGDVFHIVEPPFYEVDPIKRCTKDTLQRFKAGANGTRLTPVK